MWVYENRQTPKKGLGQHKKEKGVVNEGACQSTRVQCQRRDMFYFSQLGSFLLSFLKVYKSILYSNVAGTPNVVITNCNV